MQFTKRVTAMLAASALLAAASLLAGSGTASAAPTFTFDLFGTIGSNFTEVRVDNGSNYAGYGMFSQNPTDDDPGDAIQASDQYADGYYIETFLSRTEFGTPFRTASTGGQTSPYTTPWATGDLPEGTTYFMWICAINSSTSQCSDVYQVVS
jgi:hypothetical protein